MSNIEREISLHYGNQSAKLGRLVAEQIRRLFKKDLQIIDIGSGDVTEVYYDSVTFEMGYEFVYENDELTQIRLIAEGTMLDNDLTISVTQPMKELYNDIMLTTQLLEVCGRADSLSDEDKAHSTYWDNA